jgi:hypothetical protein
MFIPIWIITGILLILVWSIWLNFQRSKQVQSLQYSFVTISDLSINKLREVKSECEQHEGDPELVPYVVSESLQEIESEVEHLLKRQEQAGVQPYQLKDGAKELGIM